MDVPSSPPVPAAPYTTPRWVQVWFLRRSRDRWKQKYKDLKAQAKRLDNRARDVTKSRDRWRAEAEALRRHVRELTTAAAPHEQAAALKKGGPAGRPGPAGG